MKLDAIQSCLPVLQKAPCPGARRDAGADELAVSLKVRVCRKGGQIF